MIHALKITDITMPILPRFFLVSSQAGVTAMSINLDGAKERHAQGAPYTIFIDCQSATWTYYFSNGYIVTLRGPLIAALVLVPNAAPPPPPTPPNSGGAQQAPPPHFPYTFKIDTITFNAEKHEKALKLESIQGRRSEPKQRTPKMHLMKGEGQAQASPGAGSSSTPSTITSTENAAVLDDEKGNGAEMVIHYERATIPTEPVNAFGVPQATMRCLEVRSFSSCFFSFRVGQVH